VAVTSLALARRLLWTGKVSTRGGAEARYDISAGKGFCPKHLARLNNSQMGPLEEGIQVTPEQMEARLQRYPDSVRVGTFREIGSPASLINVVGRIGEEIPATHQELTSDEMFFLAVGDGSRNIFCPWVSLLPEVQRAGYAAVINGQALSLGRLHVWQVKQSALQDSDVRRLFAYSRPGGLRAYLSRFGTLSYEIGVDGKPVFFIKRHGEKRALEITKTGVLYADNGDSIVTWQEYAALRHPKKTEEVFDPTWRFHEKLGGRVLVDEIKPGGQILDLLCLGVRSPIEHFLQR